MPKYEDYDSESIRDEIHDSPCSSRASKSSHSHEVNTSVDVSTNAFSEIINRSSSRREEHWMKAYWRPTIAWSYLVTCIFDFILFPILWSAFQAYHGGSVITPWSPLTLQGAGLYHLAMAAAVGISAYSRGQEKLNDKL